MISLVTSNSSAGNGTAVVTPTLNTTGSNMIVVGVAWGSAGADPTLTDSAGNTWTLLNTETIDYLALDTYYCFNPTTSASHTFTATGNSSSAPTIDVVAFSGAPSDLPSVTRNLGGGSSYNYPNVSGTLIITLVSTIGTSHAQSGFSTASTNFASGMALGSGISWKINTAPISSQSPTWTWTGSGSFVAIALNFLPYKWQRIGTTPVLANHNQGGANIGGVQPDAYAAPQACWDGTRWVMGVSVWTIADSLWRTAFFTSSDLVSWTYVASSLQTPAGSDYIIGNGGLQYFGAKYWWCYNHYPAVDNPSGVAIAHSTDLVTWTVVHDPISGETYGADPMLMINPNSGKLELWCLTSGRAVVFNTSSDGTTWDGWSSSLANITAPGAFGTPSPWYDANGSYMSSDMGSGGRSSALFYGPFATPIYFADANTKVPGNAWEAADAFDMTPLAGLVDRGDGRGSIWWAVYAGGTNTSNVDNTDSCIGLVYLLPPGVTIAAGGISNKIVQRNQAVMAAVY